MNIFRDKKRKTAIIQQGEPLVAPSTPRMGEGFRAGKPVGDWGGSEPSNVIEAYSWDWEYWASDCDGSSWPAHGGNGPDLSRTTGAAPTLDVSTSGLLSAGLPASLVDKALRFTTGSNGFHSGGANVLWPGLSSYHYRVLFFDRTSTTIQWLFRWLRSGTDFVEHKGNSASSLANTVRSPNPYTAVVAGLQDPQTDWYLLDVFMDASGGASGNSLFTVWINGTEYNFSEHSASEIPSNNLGSFGIGGRQDGSNSPDADILFQGWRFDVAFPGAVQNLADATLLGLEGTTP